jgi:hypothetical protein
MPQGNRREEIFLDEDPRFFPKAVAEGVCSDGVEGARVGAGARRTSSK